MRLEGPTPAAGIGVRAMSAVHWHGRPLLSQELVPVAIVLSDGGAPRALSPSPHAMHGIRLQLRSDQDVEESCQLWQGRNGGPPTQPNQILSRVVAASSFRPRWPDVGVALGVWTTTACR